MLGSSTVGCYPPPQLPDSPVQRERLENGLTVLVRELHVAPVAEVQIWAGVGSADERPGELGLAHFYEHMLFKGTARRGVGEVAGEVEGVGGRINAYTSHDVTVYHATLPSRELATGVDVLSDMVRFASFDEDEIAREIEVVLEEIRRSNDSPYSVLSDAVFATAFAEHPYRSPILGPPESVLAFRRGPVVDFFRRLESEIGDRLPAWSNELYLELHRGTYTTQWRNKRANRPPRKHGNIPL